MTAPEVQRPRVPRVADERAMLEAWLDYHRATLLMKCAGLTDEQLKLRSAEPSTLSLLGLVRHLTDVERGWFRRGVGRCWNAPCWADRPPTKAMSGAGRGRRRRACQRSAPSCPCC